MFLFQGVNNYRNNNNDDVLCYNDPYKVGKCEKLLFLTVTIIRSVFFISELKMY